MRELHLFAGAGGGILGGMLLGHTCVCAVEIEPYCRQVLLQRQRDGILPLFPIWDDVCTFDGTPWRGTVDVVCAGIPCQKVSVAGDGDERGFTGTDYYEGFKRIVREVGAAELFLENSPALVVRGLGNLLGDLAEMGYNARWGVLSCADVGGVHLRERIWIKAAHYGSERIQRKQRQKIHRFSRFPWGEDVRGIEDLRRRSDLPPSLIRRIGHDVAFGVDRLHAIGNGQVPAVVRLAWETLSGNSNETQRACISSGALTLAGDNFQNL